MGTPHVKLHQGGNATLFGAYAVFINLPAYAALRQAILDREQVSCMYQGHFRLCCPHTIGTTNGVPLVLVYQFGGSSKSGLPPDGEWRCLDIPAMTQVRVHSGEWHTGYRHTRPQTCVKQVDIDITMT